MSKVFDNEIKMSRQSLGYQNYLHVRNCVINMLDEWQKNSVINEASDYWKEELEGFEYILDASPLIIKKLREHCYHLTGLRSGDYRGHHSAQAQLYAKKLIQLKAQDINHLFVPESSALGGFGHVIGDNLINLDTLKFYECLIALDKAEILKHFRSNEERKTVLEIGGGWGGFAYQFKTLCPGTTYMIVDLPQTLLFSGVYLKTLFPSRKMLIYGERSNESLLEDYLSYDFVLMPHYFFPNILKMNIDLAVNMVSFQEMTTAQVNQYLSKLKELKCKYIYSMNRDRSPYNLQLSRVSQILRQYYDLKEIKVLESTYVDLPVSLCGGGMGGVMEACKVLFRKWLQKEVFKYRHFAGIINLDKNCEEN